MSHELQGTSAQAATTVGWDWPTPADQGLTAEPPPLVAPRPRTAPDGEMGRGAFSLVDQAHPGQASQDETSPVTGRHIVFVSWRDLANPRAGGSEVLVDRLADGMTARGNQVTVLCGGPVAERRYRVVRNGGTYTQFLRAPADLPAPRRLRPGGRGLQRDAVLRPAWSRRPMVCLVNHVHTELWRLRLPRPLSHGRALHRERADALGAPEEPVPHRVLVDGRRRWPSSGSGRTRSGRSATVSSRRSR